MTSCSKLFTKEHPKENEEWNKEIWAVNSTQGQSLLHCAWPSKFRLAEVMQEKVAQYRHHRRGNMGCVYDGRQADPPTRP